MAVDWNAVGTIVGSIAGFAVTGKWLMKGVEKSNATLPVVVSSLETINEGLKELFSSRNDHDKRLERVETVHDLRGCNEPIKTHTHHRATD